MPRKANDKINLIENNDVKAELISKKTRTKKSAKEASENKKSKTKNTTVKNLVTKTSKKDNTDKKINNSNSKLNKSAKTTTKKSTVKQSKSVCAKKTSKTTQKSNKTINTKSKSKSKLKSNKIDILEYYDLPYRYNETVVKVLAQTPDTLFVYWDISDDDKKKYIEEYGEYFFNNTKPVLIVHNKTLDYSFEVNINDFANSWYLHINDSKCDYNIEIGRRPINKHVSIPNDYLYISSSNEIITPNDHILFDELGESVYFRNVKTNIVTTKNISSISSIRRLGKLYNVYNFYKKMYKDENYNFDRFDFKNPSSANPSSTFK